MQSFDLTEYAGTCWRFVEVQHKSSTMKLVDDVQAQETLERLLDETKPPVPQDCQHLHWLLFTPFRYAARHSTRFRPAGSRDGVFYCAEELQTAAAELAFYRLLFFLESPDTAIPIEPFEMTAFSCALKTDRAWDVTTDTDPALRDLVDYSACHKIAEAARKQSVEVIRYSSVRTQEGCNVAVLDCAAFSVSTPLSQETWKFRLTADRVIVLEAIGASSFEFLYQDYADDPRVADMGPKKLAGNVRPLRRT